MRDFLERYGTPNRTRLTAYRSYLIDNYKLSTVNLRILSMSKYLDATGLGKLQMKFIKLPRESFLDKVINKEDYTRFKRALQLRAEEAHRPGGGLVGARFPRTRPCPCRGTRR